MVMNQRWWPAFALRLLNISIISVLFSCAGKRDVAPIVDAAPIPTHRIQRHVVAPGETLYSIALRYDMDYKKLAQVNRLGQKNQIHAGQVLSLDLSSYTPPPPPQAKVQPRVPSSQPHVQGPQNNGQKARPTVGAVPENRTIEAKPSPATSVSSGSIKWQWPVNGKVVDGFNPSAGLNKGIDIQGKLGEPVVAAADGEVVYSGTGLRGYGKLLIVKHNEQYLSAYAHNRVLLVAEGDRVKAGQKIAEVGFSGTNTAKLHFEIRRDGKPVNPLQYLPAT